MKCFISNAQEPRKSTGWTNGRVSHEEDSLKYVTLPQLQKQRKGRQLMDEVVSWDGADCPRQQLSPGESQQMQVAQHQDLQPLRGIGRPG